MKNEQLKNKFLKSQKNRSKNTTTKIRKQDKKRPPVDLSGPGFIPGPIVKKHPKAKTVINFKSDSNLGDIGNAQEIIQKRNVEEFEKIREKK